MHDLFRRILDEGFTHSDRTGIGRRSVYNVTMDFDASKAPVIMNTQKIFYETAVKELLWMLGGHSRIDIPGLELPIWKKWTYQPGDALDKKELLAFLYEGSVGISPDETKLSNLVSNKEESLLNSVGNMYPKAWRHAPINSTPSIRQIRTLEELPSDLTKDAKRQPDGSVSPEQLKILNRRYWSAYDQVNEMFLNMKKRPYSSRHRVSAWIPEWIPDEDNTSAYNLVNNRGSLTPCHSFFQFTVGAPNAEGKNTLNLFLYQGSMDCPVGGPYNVACYTTMLHIFAHLLGYAPNRFTVSIGDAHIYTNQIDLVKEQLQREEMPDEVTLDILGDHTDPFSIKPSDIVISNYKSHPHLKYPVAA